MKIFKTKEMYPKNSCTADIWKFTPRGEQQADFLLFRSNVDLGSQLSQSATSQATSDQPKNEISGKMLQENQAELTAQTANNINPLQTEINPASEKFFRD